MSHPVYLVDDDPAVNRALSLLLSTVGFSVVTFSDPTSFLARLDDLEPGCLIVDIRMPLISGLRLQEHLAEHGIEWPTVVISGHGDIQACRRAFQNGAVDFLSKPVDEQDLIDSIQRGNEILERNLQANAERSEASKLLSLLTGREKEVLNLMSQGFSTKQIATALQVSPRTIESHRAALGIKLDTSSAVEMTRIWLHGSALP